ncbi:O-methyltransferase [Patescibacteria group bacterium]|nr:O-methyltransferase [Patescibacteria group bacterium]
MNKILNKLEKTQKQFWNISREVGIFLHTLIKETKIKKILEIGTSNGYSAIWMASALKETGGHLYTMESNKRIRYPLALQNIQAAGLQEQITAILGHAPQDLPTLPKTFDLIFLDATKHEHLSYLEALLPRTRKGSIIITDNALSHQKELSPYLKAVQTNPKLKTSILNIGTGLAISLRA